MSAHRSWLSGVALLPVAAFGLYATGIVSEAQAAVCATATLTNLCTSSITLFNNYTITSTGGFQVTGNGITNSNGSSFSLSNSGTIQVTGNGVNNNGTLTSLINEGTINSSAGSAITLGATGTLTSLTNSGKIHGAYGINADPASTIGSINNSGTLAGSTVAYGGPATTITNSGAILGMIYVNGGGTLQIIGGSGSTYGIITGYSGSNSISNLTPDISAANIGTIYNNNQDVEFVSGNILLNSNLDQGTSPGALINNGATIQINNALTHNSDLVVNSGKLVFGVTSTTVYGNMSVMNATLGSNSTIVLKALSGMTLQTGQTYRVILSNGPITNNASLVISGFTGNTFSTGYTSTPQAYLDITVGTAVAPTVLATASTATPAVDAIKTLPVTAATLNFTSAIDALSSTAEANKAGNQLRPAANGVSSQAAQAAGAQVMNVVAGRNDTMRVASSGKETGRAAGSERQGLAFWAEGFGVNTSQAHRQTVDGYNAWTGGAAAGADTQVNDNTRVGVVGSYAYTDVSDEGDRRGSGTTISSYGATLYASYSPGAWYLDGSAGIGLHRYDTSRAMNFSGFNSIARGEHDAWQYLARADAGYPLALGSSLGDAMLTPIAGLALSRLDERAYTESGGNGAALHVGAVSSTSVKSTLGVKLARSLETEWGEVTPQIKLAWLHEFADVTQASTSSYVAGGTPFSTPGVRQPRDGMIAGLGLTLAGGTGYTLSANYDVEVKTDYVSQAGRLRFRSEF